ncbi:MAG: tonB-system energizer ExbB [Methylocapsa sp.]|nr:tonB-system energizer ExbB [Methylocapsa sp.]
MDAFLIKTGQQLRAGRSVNRTRSGPRDGKPLFPAPTAIAFPRLAAAAPAAALAFLLSITAVCAQAPVPGGSPAPTAQPQIKEPSPGLAPVAAPQTSTTEAIAGSPERESKPRLQAPAALSAALPRDLSPWGMFLSADRIVQAVMMALAFASLVTWTVWLAKTVELWNAKRLARRGLEVLATAPSLKAAEKELAGMASPVVRFARAANEEAERSAGLAAEGIKDRAGVLLSRIEAKAGRAMARGTGMLATIGATAVFVGLFGTVWGIMNSFIGISRANTTNLAVVAPGIAEALLATAMGLVAAIPAVVMYNFFARSIANYRAQLGDAAAEVLRHLSRDLDRGMFRQSESGAAVVNLRRPAE